MELLKPTLFLLGGIGVINGMLLSAILLFSKSKKIENTFLGLLILMICLRIGKSIYFYYTDHIDELILQIGLTACVFIGPLFYLYVKGEQPSRTDRILLGTISLGILSIGMLYPYRTYPDAWNGPIIASIYMVWGAFVIVGLVSIRSTIVKAYQNFRLINPQERRVLIIAAGILFITASYQFAYWIQGFTYLWGSLIFTSLFYYLIFVEVRRLIQPPGRKKTVKSTPLEDGPLLLQQVEQTMQEHQLFKKPALKLKELASVTGIQAHTLSQVLNEVYPYGFATYVNEKRIEEAKKLMLSDSHFTLEGIGYESGFNSKSSFYTVFKKMTGFTPAEYKNHESTEAPSS